MKILITGGSRGIGKAIATSLNTAGHSILLVAKNKDNLIQAKNEMPNKSADVFLFPGDLSEEKTVDFLYDYTESISFKPEVLVLDAGIFIEGSLTDSKPEDLYQTMNVNLYHIYHCVKKYVSILQEQVCPKIILIGSTASLEAYPIGALYGVAKWSLKGYSVNLRKELMNKNIGVTLINPGGTLTDLWEGEDLPTDRLLEPSDIGKLVDVLLKLSPQAVVEELTVRPMLGDFHD